MVYLDSSSSNPLLTLISQVNQAQSCEAARSEGHSQCKKVGLKQEQVHGEDPLSHIVFPPCPLGGWGLPGKETGLDTLKFGIMLWLTLKPGGEGSSACHCLSAAI